MSLKITTTKNQVKRVGMYPPTTIEDHKVAKWKRKYSNFIDSGSASPMIPYMVTQVIKWFNKMLQYSRTQPFSPLKCSQELQQEKRAPSLSPS